MKIIVNGRNIDLTEAIKSHVIEKMSRLEQHFDFVQEVHVFMSVDKNPRISRNQHAEATVLVSRAVLRVEVASEDLYGSVDLLVDKVNRVLTKHKTKLLGRGKSGKSVHGESIRKPHYEEAAIEVDMQADQEAEEEGVFLTWEDEEEAELRAQQ